MSRIRFEETTPINVGNINKLNNVVIGTTEPTTGEEVWIQKGKNLFNPKAHIAIDGAFYNYENGNLTTNSDYYGVKIPVSPNTVYVTSSNLEAGYWSHLCFWDKNMNFISGDGYNSNFKVITTPSNCAFITFALLKSYTWFQLEQGSTATTYESYVEKKIHVKNDNGVYEEFYNEENLEVYSTEERRIGTWIDGKPLYQKSIFGNLSSDNSWNTIELGIQNLKHILKHDFYFDNATKQKYKAPYYENASYYVLYCVEDIEIGATTGNLKMLQNGFSSNAFRLEIKYTKTID